MRRRHVLTGAVLAGILLGMSVLWLRRVSASSVIFTIPVGSVSMVYNNPAYRGALAVDARTGVAAVASAGVTLLDTRTGTVLSTVSIRQGYTTVLAVDERAAHVLVASGNVTVLDAQRGIPLHAVPAALFPLDEIVDGRTGHAFILNGRGYRGQVTMIDTRTGRLLHTTTISTQDSLFTGAVDARTGRAFVTSSVDDSVSVLDTRTGQLVATDVVARSPQAVAVDEARGHVFIASSGVASGGAGLSVLDARRGTVLRIQRLTMLPLALAVDARVAHVFLVNATVDSYGDAAGISSISLLDARSGALIRTVPIPATDTPATMVTMAVDDRRDRVFVLSPGPQDSASPGQPTVFAGDGHLYVFDAHSGALLRTLPTGVGPVAMGIDDGTGHVVVLDAGGTVAVPDPWGWMPGWVRHAVPFLTVPRMHNVPSSVHVLDPAR